MRPETCSFSDRKATTSVLEETFNSNLPIVLMRHTVPSSARIRASPKDAPFTSGVSPADNGTLYQHWHRRSQHVSQHVSGSVLGPNPIEIFLLPPRAREVPRDPYVRNLSDR